MLSSCRTIYFARNQEIDDAFKLRTMGFISVVEEKIKNLYSRILEKGRIKSRLQELSFESIEHHQSMAFLRDDAIGIEIAWVGVILTLKVRDVEKFPKTIIILDNAIGNTLYYQDYIEKLLHDFGFSRSQMDAFNKGIIVKFVDNDPDGLSIITSSAECPPSYNYLRRLLKRKLTLA